MTKHKRKVRHFGYLPLVVDFLGLKAMGWPFSRVETIERGDGRYPKPYKLGPHHNARVVFRVQEVLDWFESHGLPVTQDWHRALLSDDEERTLEAAE